MFEMRNKVAVFVHPFALLHLIIVSHLYHHIFYNASYLSHPLTELFFFLCM